MPTFSRTAERHTVMVNVKMTPGQVEVLDRLARELGLGSRGDVLRAGLDRLLAEAGPAVLGDPGAIPGGAGP